MNIKINRILIASIALAIILASCLNKNEKVPELSFETHKFSDKIHLYGNENYPSCDIDISVMTPEDSSYYKNLEENMLQVYFDTLYKINANIDDLLYLSAQSFFEDFKKNEEFIIQDTLEMGASLSWQIIIQNDIVYQDEHFVSFMKELYAYTGGAHGNTNMFYYVFDLDDKKLLNASDVFVTGECNALIELQKQSLNEIFEDTSGFWLDGLKCDSNFYLVENGFVFHYDQYEIASYAAGPIDIFLSFDEMEPFLQRPDHFLSLRKE